ncbi:hypothetical protein [Nitratireductor pacificus]|uniref:Uncharacterized protein n=1 Tax=Nitratireductor pacificus pht-3B TaxID=391937 RepID=K2M986_9HYPH|nr:hypothetical protein [Nitratireductor pacificus]EKF18656.1 hypothetical protein NA2_12189 [Nitratireductor pacificus pht-3B]
MARRQSDDDQRSESRRILDRVGQESENALLHRMRRHVAADDARQDDPIELWGTRIGRVIALAVLAATILWLLLNVFGG